MGWGPGEHLDFTLKGVIDNQEWADDEMLCNKIGTTLGRLKACA